MTECDARVRIDPRAAMVRPAVYETSGQCPDSTCVDGSPGIDVPKKPD
jgi:hypothetical protein